MLIKSIKNVKWSSCIVLAVLEGLHWSSCLSLRTDSVMYTLSIVWEWAEVLFQCWQFCEARDLCRTAICVGSLVWLNELTFGHKKNDFRPMLCYKIYLSQFFEIFLKHFMNPRTWRQGHNIFFYQIHPLILQSFCSDEYWWCSQNIILYISIKISPTVW